NAVSFPLYIPIYRFTIQGDSIEDGKLWQEKLSARSELLMNVSPNERKQNIEIGVTNGYGYRKICDTKPVPTNMSLVLSTDEIRDAFADSGVPAGIVTAKTRSSRTVASNV